MRSGTGIEIEIEELLSERTGRPCLFVPSGRIALYLAFRAWLSPGQRLLMSPLDDDVVLFAVMAAGLRPVMAPLAAEDGNIEPSSIPDSTWTTLGGVLTTNLYGLPDRVGELADRCQHLGIPLIEDVAHAIESELDGRPLGTAGSVGAFSLSKHVDGAGGIISFPEQQRRRQLARLRDEVTRTAGMRRRLLPAATTAKAVVDAVGLGRPLRVVRDSLGLGYRPERTDYRMPLNRAQLREALRRTPAVDPFDPWLRVDRNDYRVRPDPARLERSLGRLRAMGDDATLRRHGVSLLSSHPAAAAAVKRQPQQPLFRVPLLVEDRDALVLELGGIGIAVQYIYDPPLDDYAGQEFVDGSPDRDVARWWARHALPVDPLDAARLVGTAPSASVPSAVRLVPAVPTS